MNISLLRFTLIRDTVKFSTSDGISLQQKTQEEIEFHRQFKALILQHTRKTNRNRILCNNLSNMSHFRQLLFVHSYNKSILTLKFISITVTFLCKPCLIYNFIWRKQNKTKQRTAIERHGNCPKSKPP